MARYTGHIATLQISGQADLAQVLNISGPGITRDTIDTTDADATNDWRTRAVSYLDGGEITAEVNYDPDNATHDTTSASGFLAFAQDPRTYILSFPDSTPETWTFSGAVTGVEPSNPHDGTSTVSFTVKVLGEITFSN